MEELASGGKLNTLLPEVHGVSSSYEEQQEGHLRPAMCSKKSGQSLFDLGIQNEGGLKSPSLLELLLSKPGVTISQK